MLWAPLLFFTWLASLFASASSSDLIVRNLPGKSSADTVREIRRLLHARAITSKTGVLFDNSTSLDHAFDGKKLFEYKQDVPIHGRSGSTKASIGVEITCSKCYIAGKARAKLTANGSLNVTKIANKAKTSIEHTFQNINAYLNNITNVIGKDIKNLDAADIPHDVSKIPPPPFDFDTDLEFSEYTLEVEFENTEFYIELETVVSAGITYTFSIYSSKNLGADIDGLFFGVVFSVDLILSVENEIDIKSGFHIKLDDKMLMTIALFAKEASHLDYHGGKFEFLPVTIQSGDTILKAVLRLQVRAGFAINIDKSLVFDIDGLGLNLIKFGSGIEARVYANVAEFVTNVTKASNDTAKRDQKCARHVLQDYKMAIGAAAGATIQFLNNTWGPIAKTEIPIYYTNLLAACIMTADPAATTTTSIVQTLTPAKRQDHMSTVTTTTEITYTATVCKSSTLINCPASLQAVTENVVTKTLSTSVHSGATPLWSPTITSGFKTVDFRDGAMSMTASKDKKGVNKPLIIGLSVGLGVPVLALVIAGLFFFLRKQRHSSPTLDNSTTIIASSKVPSTYTQYRPVNPEED
ncbi:hypothetical protein PT974_07725 [Cladobotryum mycophilum]|uniref:Mid2 domain-containing protein n=1 Tax=Cladobotryum mycophilum TaxID=491253 RepID=A0ABR0SHP7_9HYPO